MSLLEHEPDRSRRDDAWRQIVSATHQDRRPFWSLRSARPFDQQPTMLEPRPWGWLEWTVASKDPSVRLSLAGVRIAPPSSPDPRRADPGGTSTAGVHLDEPTRRPFGGSNANLTVEDLVAAGEVSMAAASPVNSLAGPAHRLLSAALADADPAAAEQLCEIAVLAATFDVLAASRSGLPNPPIFNPGPRWDFPARLGVYTPRARPSDEAAVDAVRAALVAWSASGVPTEAAELRPSRPPSVSSPVPPASGATLTHPSHTAALRAEAEELHAQVDAEWASFCFDLHAAINRPLLHDVTVPTTAAFFQAQADAEALRPTSGARHPADWIERYHRAVQNLDEAWTAADRHAREAGADRLDPAEQRRIRQAHAALDRALDHRTPAAERDVALRIAADLLGSIGSLPAAARTRLVRQLTERVRREI